MISRSGVCGLNFTKRSSFSTSGLRRAHVVKARRIRPVVGNQFNPGFRAERLHHEPREFEHGNFLRAADIKISPRAFSQFCKRTSASTTSFTRQKAARLFAVAETSAARFFFAAAMKRGKTIP